MGYAIESTKSLARIKFDLVQSKLVFYANGNIVESESFQGFRHACVTAETTVGLLRIEGRDLTADMLAASLTRKCVDVAMLAESARHDTAPYEGKVSEGVTFDNTAWGGGSTYILKLGGASFFVGVLRTPSYRNWGGTIGGLSGGGNGKDPVWKSLAELSEEVIILKNGTAVVPVFVDRAWSKYNTVIRDKVREMARYFGVSTVMHAAETAPWSIRGKREEVLRCLQDKRA